MELGKAMFVAGTLREVIPIVGIVLDDALNGGGSYIFTHGAMITNTSQAIKNNYE